MSLKRAIDNRPYNDMANLADNKNMSIDIITAYIISTKEIILRLVIYKTAWRM